MVVFSFSCSASEKDSLTKKAEILKDAYEKCVASNENKRYRKKFFAKFPGTFNEFVQLYGYENNSPNVLYYEAEKHIPVFLNSIKYVDDTIYYKKIINIAIDGRWDADAVNFLQDGIQKNVLKNIDLTLYFLQKRTEREAYSFWVFYFDGPHPEKSIDKRLNVIAAKNPEMYKIITKAHKDVVKDWEKE